MRALALLIPGVALAEPSSTTPTVTIGGYLEAYYQANFQNPSNRLTNIRGYDNRNRTFTIHNVALDVKATRGPVTAQLVLQIGHAPSTYYLAEPLSPGTSTVDTSSSELWKYIQTATIGYAAPHAVLVEGGVFQSPIGLESISIKDDMNWSASNLAFGLPSYHTGARATKPLGGAWKGTFAVYNGWSSVVDNNGYPSIAVSAAYQTTQSKAQVLYFGGIEWPTGAPEGAPWRNLLDVTAQHAVTGKLTLAANADAGIEWNDFGTSAWATVVGYAKYALTDEVYVAVRPEYFYEWTAEGARPMFWDPRWIASGTVTLAYQPASHVSVRLEYRHDQAASDAYFGGDVAVDPLTKAFVPDREQQDTLTLGVTAWFSEAR